MRKGKRPTPPHIRALAMTRIDEETGRWVFTPTTTLTISRATASIAVTTISYLRRISFAAQSATSVI